MTLINKLNELSNEEPIIISSIGPIASGKSFFLSALHTELGYSTKEIKIEKLKMNDIFFESRILRKNENYEKSYELLEKVQQRHKSGIRRLAGTSEPDKLEIFAYLENKIIPINFYAPGGHDTAIKLKENPEGALYFVDSNFMAYSNLLEEKELNCSYRDLGKEYIDLGERHVLQYSIKDFLHPNSPEDKKGIGFGLPINSDNYGWCLEKYNGEILGNVIDSVYKSKTKMEEVIMKKIPLEIIIKTDNKSEYKLIKDSLSKEDLVNVINDSIKNITQKYIDYLTLHNKEDLQKLDIKIPSKDFKLIDSNLPLNIIDSSNHKKKKVRNTVYNLVKKVLENKGYETSNLKLINFTESKDLKTIYYKKILEE